MRENRSARLAGLRHDYSCSDVYNLELGLNSVLVDSASVCTYMHCVFMSTMQLQQRRCDEACHVRAEIYHDGVRHNGQSKSRTGASYFFVKAQSL